MSSRPRSDPVRWPQAVVVLTTGTGLERVLRVAGSLGQGEASVRKALAQSTVVCRGPKPIAVLKREVLPVHVRAESPHTTRELLAALSTIAVHGRDAVVVQDGGSGRTALESLAARGARVFEVRPYEWALPEDVEPLRGLVGTLTKGAVDALAVTTQVQARHLDRSPSRWVLRASWPARYESASSSPRWAPRVKPR